MPLASVTNDELFKEFLDLYLEAHSNPGEKRSDAKPKSIPPGAARLYQALTGCPHVLIGLYAESCLKRPIPNRDKSGSGQ